MQPGLTEILIFIPAILILGCITTYQDIKEGRIRNKYIILSLIYTFLAYLLLISIYKTNNIPIRISYLQDLIINLLIAFLLSVIFWLSNIWSAADAKLFTAYCCLVPLSIYSNSYVRYFPSIVILINSFVPFFIFTFFRIILPTELKAKKEALKKIKLTELSALILSVLWIKWIIDLVFNKLNKKPDFFISLAIMMFSIILLYKIFKSKTFLISLIISTTLIVINYNNIFSIIFLKGFLILFFMISIFFLIPKISYLLFSKKIKINELKEGMIISEIIYKENSNYKKISIELNPNKKPQQSKQYLALEAHKEGNALTKKDIKKLKSLYKLKKLGFSNLEIQQTMPFAPVLFLGVLLTLISRGNFVIFLRDIIARFIK